MTPPSAACGHEPTEQAGAAWQDEPIGLGARLGCYELQSVIGAGGMGVVFEARDAELDRVVAIKILRAGAGAVGREGASRLWREGIIAARLAHPNVIRVHEVGIAQGQVFVAMELVRGQTLAGWISATSRTTDEITAAFMQAGRGLAVAHDSGLVHRDFKPQNVLVGNDGRVLITDFGLALAIDEGARSLLNRSGPFDSTVSLVGHEEVAGTPAYMAPEQLRAGPIDARADQYSFCVALWRALSGTQPGMAFRPVSAQVLSVISRGLEVVPERRFRTMHELLAGLELAVAR